MVNEAISDRNGTSKKMLVVKQEGRRKYKRMQKRKQEDDTRQAEIITRYIESPDFQRTTKSSEKS